MTIPSADDATFEQLAERRAGLVLVDFWAPSCGPCAGFSKTLEALALETGVAVVKVNVEDAPDAAVRYGARSLPLLVVLRDGREVGRSIGAVSKERIKKLLATL